MNFRRDPEAAERARERKQREDDAPRLAAELPRLANLKLEVAYRRGDVDVAEAKHTQRIMIDRAPALFVIKCADRTCKGGGHDVTAAVMRGLRANAERFEGSDTCHGTVGTASCAGTVRWVAVAEYKS